MKTVFWKQGHSAIPVAPCPFLGVKVDSFEEFVGEILQKRLFKPIEPGSNRGWYPPVIFSTKDSGQVLCFRGSHQANPQIPINPNTGQQYKWWLWDVNTMEPIQFFTREQLPEIMNLFDDSEIIDRKVSAVGRLIKERGGIAIELWTAQNLYLEQLSTDMLVSTK